jgi:enamine deaminase RidA (YjgF/YER057c/UK114 family)
MIRKVTTPAVPEPPGGAYSQCLVVGDNVFIAGQTAGAPGGGILGNGSMEDQTRQAFKKIKALIEAAGATMADIVKLTVYVTDMSKRPEVWVARKEFFTADFPCSTLIGISSLAEPAMTVEIDATAIIGASKGR